MFRNTWLVVWLAWVVVPVVGCSTLRSGGGPQSSFDVESDLKALEAHFGSAVAIENIYAGGATLEKRDCMIAGRLVMMNLRYLQFIRSINAEKQFIDTASDILILSLNLAGTAFTPQTTKTALAALSAGVAGSKGAIDKNYFYEKTMPALVATMNAQRKQVLLSILRGVGKSLDVYSVEQAITDLDAYYHAGTLIGAINAIQEIAGDQEQGASKEIAEITRDRVNALLSNEARTRVRSIGDAIEKLTDFAKAKAVLIDLGYDEAKITDMSEAKKQMKAALRERGHNESKISDMYKVFSANGLLN